MADELPILPFASAAAFEEWLEALQQPAKRAGTRERRIEQYVVMLARGETLH